MTVREIFTLIICLFLVSCNTNKPTPGIQRAYSNPSPFIVTPETPRADPPPTNSPIVRAESAIVLDATSGRILYQKNARTERAVASTQKLLTALVVSRSGPLSDPVTVTTSDTQVEPSKLYVKPGETYARKTLVKALLVRSGNDIAKALARDVAGTEANFCNRMNEMARAVGMRQSHFKNPHGLTEPGQYSTALDIALLGRQVMKHPFLRECMRIKNYTFTYSDGRTKVLKNTNKLLTRLPYCTGMKTGTTNASGRCLISAGTYKGRSVIAVALGSTSAEIWNDSEKLLRWALE